MNEKLKSQRGFVAVTLITLLAIALVLVVYATLLGTFTGKEVVYGATLDGEVLYSTTNQEGAGNWTDKLNITTGTAWYALLNITSTSGYVGQVNATFQLQEKQDGIYTDTGSTTVATITLNGTAGERVYVTNDGSGPTGNRDWQPICTAGHSYRVEATVETTG